MISPQKISELATKEQTTDINIAREYLQHLFLSHFYKKSDSENFLFKGGTALRIIFGSPRYSEDLDFSIPKLDIKKIEDLLTGTFVNLESEGIITKFDIDYAEPTTGGYIANIKLNILGFETGIKSNLQIKSDNSQLEKEAHIIENAPFLTSYSLTALNRKLIVQEKIQALIQRFKPRDFFDFYFIMRKDGLKEYITRNEDTVIGILNALEGVSDKSLEDDLKPFLPVNFQSSIGNLKTAIKQNLGR